MSLDIECKQSFEQGDYDRVLSICNDAINMFKNRQIQLFDVCLFYDYRTKVYELKGDRIQAVSDLKEIVNLISKEVENMEGILSMAKEMGDHSEIDPILGTSPVIFEFKSRLREFGDRLSKLEP